MKRATAQLLLDTLCLRNDSRVSTHAWTAADTSELLALVRHEGAEIWLSRRLQQRGVVLPDAFREALRIAVKATTLTNMRIDAQTTAVTSMLTAARMPWRLIKGQARRAAEDRYPMANARPISDVDLLVHDAHVDAAWALLRERGFKRIYEEGEVDWVVTHHLPALIDETNVSVELHRTFNDSVPPAEAWRRSTEHPDAVSWSGIETTVPNATELLWQALTHGVADGDNGFYLRTFLNVSSILASDESIDWGVVEARVTANEVRDSETHEVVPHERLCQWLDIAATLAGVAVPTSLRPTHTADVSTILAWRATVLATSRSRRVKQRLLGEIVRFELGLPFTKVWGTSTFVRRVRARVSATLWRTCYRLWRVSA